MSVPNQLLESSGGSPALPPPEKSTGSTEITTAQPDPDSSKSCTYLREATPDDLARLPRVADKIPVIVWLVAFIGAAQRFAYYGTTIPWRMVNLVIDFYEITNSG